MKQKNKNYTLFRRKLKNQRNVTSSFTSVYGVHTTLATFTLALMGFSPYAKLKDLPVNLWETSTSIIDSQINIDRQLTRRALTSITENVRNGSYKGLRFSQGLPVHGQRTHSNARTARRLFRGKFVKAAKVKGLARQKSKNKAKK